MNNLTALLRALDDLYYTVSQEEYERERAKVDSQIATVLPGFTIAHALEIGTVGAGEDTYVHGGARHVLLPQ